jgi:tetratricopeptide (TPR) repeat protein
VLLTSAVPADELGAQNSAAPPSITGAKSIESAVLELERSEQQLSETQAVAAYKHVAALAEMVGNLEVGLDMYSSAADLGDEESSLSAAALLFELGRLEEAETRARELVLRASDYGVRRRASVLVGRCMALSGRGEEAVALLSTVASIEDAEHLDSEVLLMLHQVALSEGNLEKSESARRRLLEDFPGSLEAALVRGDALRVELSPSLPRFFSPTTPPAPTIGANEAAAEATEEPSGSDQPGSDQPDTGESAIGVQTGSFRDPENAEYMAKDLRALGFAVEILSREEDPATPRSDQPLYRVVVVGDGEPGDVLMRLKNKGVEGFLVF